jgi:hypothetical protein
MVTVRSCHCDHAITIGVYVIGSQRVEHVQPYFSSRESLSKGPEGE